MRLTSLDGCGSRSAGQKFPKIVSRSSRLIRKNLRLILKKKTFYMLGHPADTRFTKFISQHTDLYMVLTAHFFFWTIVQNRCPRFVLTPQNKPRTNNGLSVCQNRCYADAQIWSRLLYGRPKNQKKKASVWATVLTNHCQTIGIRMKKFGLPLLFFGFTDGFFQNRCYADTLIEIRPSNRPRFSSQAVL